MNHIDLFHEVIHTAEYLIPREVVIKWLRLNAPHYQFTDRTAKSKLARMFAVSYYKDHKDVLFEAAAIGRARSKYETWLGSVKQQIREGSLRSVRSYFSTNEGDYLTIDKRERFNNPDTAGGYI